jgi:hypothetical protein
MIALSVVFPFAAPSPTGNYIVEVHAFRGPEAVVSCRHPARPGRHFAAPASRRPLVLLLELGARINETLGDSRAACGAATVIRLSHDLGVSKRDRILQCLSDAERKLRAIRVFFAGAS